MKQIKINFIAIIFFACGAVEHILAAEWDYIYRIKDKFGNSTYIHGGEHFGSMNIESKLGECVLDKLKQSELIVFETSPAAMFIAPKEKIKKLDRKKYFPV